MISCYITSSTMSGSTNYSTNMPDQITTALTALKNPNSDPGSN